MLYRIFTVALVLVSSLSIAKDEPRLFLGVNVGSSFMAISPPNPATSSNVTPLTLLLSGNSNNFAISSYNNEALLETSSTFDNHILVNPTLGMTFPVTNRIQLEGFARVDAIEKEFTVKSLNSTEKTIAKISREIGLGGSLLMRISKQYSIGPTAEAIILTNETPLYPAAKEKDYTVYEFGIQSVYRFHEYFTIGIMCSASLDQSFEVKDTISSVNNTDLVLDYKVARAQISLRLTPI